jgi:hypothetical protein
VEAAVAQHHLYVVVDVKCASDTIDAGCLVSGEVGANDCDGGPAEYRNASTKRSPIANNPRVCNTSCRSFIDVNSASIAFIGTATLDVDSI